MTAPPGSGLPAESSTLTVMAFVPALAVFEAVCGDGVEVKASFAWRAFDTVYGAKVDVVKPFESVSVAVKL